jgi:hypothetical protein
LRCHDSRAAAVVVTAFPAGAFAAAAYFLTSTAGASTVLLLLALSCASLLPVVEAWLRGARLLELGVAVALFSILLFPVRALVVLFDLDPLVNPDVLNASASVIDRTLLVATLGLLAGGLAYISPLGTVIGRRLPMPSLTVCESPPRLLGAVVFLLGFAADAVILAGNHFGAVESLLRGRGSGLVSETATLIIIGLSLLAVRAVAPGTQRDRAVLLVAVTATLLLSIVGQFKEVGFFAIGAPLIVIAYTRERRMRLRPIVAAAAVVLVMFVAVDLARLASDRIGSTNPLDVARAYPTQVVDYAWYWPHRRPLEPWSPFKETAQLVSRRFYGFDSLALAVRFTPGVVPYQDGATLRNLAAGLVPRLVWPGKPSIGIGYWFATVYWPSPVGVKQVPQSVTHIGELWIDFGWFGVIVGMAILGLLYRILVTAIGPGSSSGATIVYAVVLLTAVVVDRDLPLVYVTLIQRLAVVAVVLGTVEVVYRMTRRRRSPLTPTP